MTLGAAGLAVAALTAAASPATAKTVTKTATFNQCVNPAAAIFDEKSTSATLFVPVPKNGRKVQSGTVTAVNSAALRITTLSASDLDISLISPGGRVIGLAIGRGGSGDGFGSGTPNCTGQLVAFSDSFAIPIADTPNVGSDPVTGSFKPEQPLSSFAGGPARGFWTLLVTDCCGGATTSGSVDAFSLNLTYKYKKPKKKKK